ncbi:MAG: cardiolipin synthase ClsB [Planctomycetes bacterium]|nr:cardiolipin synthase ClsB [Planctomycetota bacterium]
MSHRGRRFSKLRRAGIRLFERYLRYITRPERMHPWNRVQPLIGGKQAYPEMLAAIRSARSHVHFEIYILLDDRIGLEFRDALVERAKAGVTVRMLYDSLGCFGLGDSFLGPLRDAGAQLLEYAPLFPWRRDFGLNRRDHQKILVVDDRVAFAGGINVGLDYVPVEEGGGGWYDVHARVEGPAVHDLAVLFRKTWTKRGGASFPAPGKPEPALPQDGISAPGVQVISNVGARSRSHMRHAYLRAIRRAEKTISIMNAYFIPDRGLRRAFARAARRGVSVRVIVPSTTDVQAVRYASRHLYGALMKAGVRIFEWPGAMMHAKCGVIDEVWSTIGSYNLDKRSLLHNLEVALVVIDSKVGEELGAEFAGQLARCAEVDPAQWEQRSWWQKSKEWLFYGFRYWL